MSTPAFITSRAIPTPYSAEFASPGTRPAAAIASISRASVTTTPSYPRSVRRMSPIIFSDMVAGKNPFVIPSPKVFSSSISG